MRAVRVRPPAVRHACCGNAPLPPAMCIVRHGGQIRSPAALLHRSYDRGCCRENSCCWLNCHSQISWDASKPPSPSQCAATAIPQMAVQSGGGLSPGTSTTTTTTVMRSGSSYTRPSCTPTPLPDFLPTPHSPGMGVSRGRSFVRELTRVLSSLRSSPASQVTAWYCEYTLFYPTPATKLSSIPSPLSLPRPSTPRTSTPPTGNKRAPRWPDLAS